MSLNWNAQAVRDFAKIDEERMRGVMDALIWGTMIVGMPEISGDENSKCYFKRFFNRIDFAQKLQGPLLRKAVREEDGSEHGEDVPITLEYVQRFIGLKTNVSYETPSKWISRFVANEKRGF